MNPLKQGLKLDAGGRKSQGKYAAFIHESIKTRVETRAQAEGVGGGIMHLSMNPLKQGLKLKKVELKEQERNAFIHESIKTRVETDEMLDTQTRELVHLSMNPLKQGLKRETFWR